MFKLCFIRIQDSLGASYAGTVHEKQPLSAGSQVARPSTVQSSSFYRNGSANGTAARSSRSSRASNGHGNGRINGSQYPELQPGDVVL